MSNKVIVQAAAAGSANFKQLLWQKIKIRKSLDEICHYLELTLPVSERGKVRKHDKIEVRVFNPLISESEDNGKKRRVTTIMADEVTCAADSSQKTLTVIGRSPARDIIDSTWSGSILNQTKLEAIACEIAGRFGITAGRFPGDNRETGPVFNFSWENESPWTKLINEADNQGYLFTSNEAGNLYLWRAAASARTEGFLLEEGKNIREVQDTENGAEQFHEYVVRAAWKEAVEIDSSCRNKRILTINLTDSSVAEEVLRRRAKTEMLRRREKRTTVTVSGWGLNDFQIKNLGGTNGRELFWNPNFLTPVIIPSLGLNANLLVSQVEYTADPSSMTAALTLVKAEAYL